MKRSRRHDSSPANSTAPSSAHYIRTRLAAASGSSSAGSIAFNALSRSSLLLAEHPEDPDRRIVVRGKGNLSAEPEAVEFEIKSHSFQANGHKFNVPLAAAFTTSSLKADDVLSRPAAPAPAGEARTDARQLVADALADGDWHEASKIIADCEQNDIYKRAVQRAADDLGVEKAKRGFPASSHWRLARHTNDTLSPVTPVTSGTSVETAQIDSNDRGDRQDTDDRDARVTSAVTTSNDGSAIDCEVLG